MSELARRRDARDLWVSRSHLHAAIVAASLVALIGFAGGYALGRTKTGASAGGGRDSLTDAVAGEDLVALLATVERSALAHPSQAMAYPSWIEGKGGIPVPPPGGEEPGVEAVVAPAPGSSSVDADGLPDAAWTVEVGTFDDEAEARRVRDHLRDQAQPAFMTVRVREGARRFWVGVGGYDARAEATAAAGVLAPIVAGAPAKVGVPRAAEVPEVDTTATLVEAPTTKPAGEVAPAAPAVDEHITD